MPKISIIIPVYNVENYLRECLDSVQCQTLEEIEVICVDDGSTDSSGKILDEYSQNDSRFHIIHKINEGYGKAMNIGIGLATAPYIGVVESDDKVAIDMFEKLYFLMEDKKVDLLKTDFYEFYDDGKGNYIEEYSPLIFDEKFDKLYENKFNIREHEEALLFHRYTWNGLFNKEFLWREKILHNETPGASFQDNGFWFQTMIKAKNIYFARKAYYRYRIDNPNSSMYSKTKPFAICAEYDFVKNILSQMGCAGKRYYRWINRIKIVDCIYTIGRVEERYKVPLAERIKKDFIQAANLGDIDASLYNDIDKKKIFEILANPILYVENEKLKGEKIKSITRKYDIIILYGAGTIGKKVQKILKEGRLNVKIKFFGVTDMEDNPNIVLGIPVKRIDDLLEYREKALVIISVGRGCMEILKSNLERLGFKNYIMFRDLIE